MLAGAGNIWIDDVSLKEAAGGPELLWEAEIDRAVRGYYNPVDCAMLDELVESARTHGVYLQLCLLTRDAYMKDLHDPGSQQYDGAITDAQNLLRYAVARWGYSTSIITWEYFNELDPGLPAERFYHELATYLDRVDVYHHLRSTSTWHPSRRDCQNADLDVADMHFYLRPGADRKYDDEVAAVMGCAQWLRESAPQKPALLGEFGLANQNWGLTEAMKSSDDLSDFHNAIWASALSGLSGTAMSWWWERLDRHDHYPQYQPLSNYLRDIPWTSAKLRPTTATLSATTLRLVGLQAPDRLYAWLFDPAASFESRVLRHQRPEAKSDVQLLVRDLEPGTYRASWWDTRTGQLIQQNQLPLSQPGSSQTSLPPTTATLTVPPWDSDIAVKLVRE